MEGPERPLYHRRKQFFARVSPVFITIKSGSTISFQDIFSGVSKEVISICVSQGVTIHQPKMTIKIPITDKGPTVPKIIQ